MATVQCGGPPTRATHVTMPARLLRGDVLQCGAASAGARGRRGVCGEPAHLPLGPSRFSWPPTCCFCAFFLADSGFLPSRSVYDLYGRRPLAAHEPEQVQLPSASAGGADPVSSGASVSPDHLITTTTYRENSYEADPTRSCLRRSRSIARTGTD